MASTCMLTGQDMMDSGKTIFKMDLEEKLGTTVPIMKDSTNKAKSKVGACISGMMGLNMKVTGKKIRSKAKELTNGLMGGASKASGLIIIWME